MSYFKKLNLPLNPLRDTASVIKTHLTGGYNIVMPQAVLTDEIINIFRNLGLRPKMVVLFGRNDSDSSTDDRLIHTDLMEDATCERGWRKLVAGVNWEIEGSINDFYWYDMSAVKECYPNDPYTPPKYQHLNGIHYVERLKMGIPEQAVLLDHTVIDSPTLVRTDIPHATLYKNKNTTRVGISVRFYEEDFDHSWDGAVEKFNSVIK
jgi:hypothetical protein